MHAGENSVLADLSCKQLGAPESHDQCSVMHAISLLQADSSIVNGYTCCSLVPPSVASLPCLISSCLLLLLVVIELANKLPTLHILALGLFLCVLRSWSMVTINRISCLLALLLYNPLLSSLSPEQSCQELECIVCNTSPTHNPQHSLGQSIWCTYGDGT